MSERYEKLKTLLQELFQLDQPDLDFGFYRIMHAKSAEVTQFLEQDLLPQVKAAVAQYQPADKAALEKELAKAIEQAQALGADPETLPKVKELRARLDHETVDLDALEAVVAITRARGSVVLNPRAETVLRSGDRARVFGLPDQIVAFRREAGA